ncbi:PAS domain-containing protein [Caldimonas tepidiphila]|uniref:PAS domain-containing protein n=1 Tax=Caldimonas tepidiphila TaxID=2315841 RepID=UPI00196A9261|nr:PAS domain S-box protein [Caldimonas tepidiphila]
MRDRLHPTYSRLRLLLPLPAPKMNVLSPEDSNALLSRLQDLCENATVALFVMDEHQHCVYMNGAAELLTGFTLPEVQGRPLHDFVHHHRPDGTPYPLAECPIDRAAPQNNQQQGEEVFIHKDGHFYPVAFTASPIRHEDKVVGTVIEVQDISTRKRQEAA